MKLKVVINPDIFKGRIGVDEEDRKILNLELRDPVSLVGGDGRRLKISPTRDYLVGAKSAAFNPADAPAVEFVEIQPFHGDVIFEFVGFTGTPKIQPGHVAMSGDIKKELGVKDGDEFAFGEGDNRVVFKVCPGRDKYIGRDILAFNPEDLQLLKRRGITFYKK